MNDDPHREERAESSSRRNAKPLFAVNRHGSVKYNGDTIYYNEYENKTGKSLKIKCRSNQILRKFVTETCEAFMNDNAHTSSNIYEYTEGMWMSSKINVRKTRSNLYLSSENDKKIFDGVRTFQSSKQFYADKGVPYKKSFMFEGPPGTGKTATVFAMGNEFDLPIYYITREVISSSTNTNYALREINRGILLFDEIDMLMSETDEPPKESTTMTPEKAIRIAFGKRIPSTQVAEPNDATRNVLKTLDGYSNLEGCILVFTTNYPEKINPRM